MTAYLDVFIPAFGLLALGAVLRRFLLRDGAVWAGIERLVFWALMPALLVSSIASVDLAELPLGRMALAIWLALLGGTALSLLLAGAARLDHPATTSVLQGGIRFNNLMGFAIAGAIWGAPGLALAAVATGLIVPFVQAVATVAFALGAGRQVTVAGVAWQVMLNPLILACLAGFAATAALKLGVMPALTLALAALLGLGPLATAVAVLFMALPTAATSYVMARAMGGDARLMAAITTSEHVAAMVTLPVWVWMLSRGV